MCLNKENREKVMLKKIIVLSVSLFLMNACASTEYSRTTASPYSKSETTKVPVYERSVTYTEDMNQPKVITTAALDKQYQSANNKKSVPASRKAVIDLINQSKQSMDKNDYVSAENSLKRALRIEPSNAKLWHNMAVVNFYQENYHQAIQQALKSNNLAKNNRQLIANNSKVIKQSYIELGEPDKAKKY